MYFGQNIKLLRKRKGFSQELVSTRIGVKRSSLSGYENGDVQPPFDVLIKLSEFYNINIDKLLTYDFTKVRETELLELEKGNDIDIKGRRLRILTSAVTSENEETIELISQKAKAGYTVGYSDPEYIKDLPVFNLPFLSSNKKFRAFPISGNSMPPVSDGSYVIAEYVLDWTAVKNNEPCIVVTKDDGIVFKLAHNCWQEEAKLWLSSTNPMYQPYSISLNDVLELWKFTAYISLEFSESAIPADLMSQIVLELQRDVSMLKTKFS